MPLPANKHNEYREKQSAGALTCGLLFATKIEMASQQRDRPADLPKRGEVTNKDVAYPEITVKSIPYFTKLRKGEFRFFWINL